MIRNKFLKVAIIWFIMCFLLIALVDSYCRAEPYLVYSPTIRVVGYQLDLDGEVIDVEPTLTPAGTYQLIYDLSAIEEGAHTVRARAQFELWGWVPWSESFSIMRPARMQGPQITTNPQLP